MSRLAAVALIGLAFGAAAAFVFHAGPNIAPSGAIVTGKAAVGGPFTLVDHTGKAVTEKDFLGRHALVFFGFTNCPDICPSALQTMAAALDALGAKAGKVTPLFITLDPERDTPDRLAKYVASFHPRLVGLTGSREQVEQAAKAYRVYFKKNESGAAPGDYTIDHSSFVYLMDPRGNFAAHFAHGASAASIAKRLSEIL